MASVGQLERAVNLAQNVELLVEDTAEAVTSDPKDKPTFSGSSDKFFLMRDISFEKTHPESRMSHGTDRTYGHGPPDIGMSFMIAASEDAHDILMVRNTRNSLGVLPIHNWQIKLSSVGGDTETSTEVKTYTALGKLRDTYVRKMDGDNSGFVEIECFIRFTSENVTVS